MKYNAIQTSEVVVMDNNVKFEIKRIFYLNKKYREYDLNGIINLIDEFNKSKNIKTYVIAVKYGVVDNFFNMFRTKIKIVHVNEISNASDWYVNQIYATEYDVLNKDVDPVILVMSDKRYLKYRINYYLDLVRSGVTEEEALKIVFS